MAKYSRNALAMLFDLVKHTSWMSEDIRRGSQRVFDDAMTRTRGDYMTAWREAMAWVEEAEGH